MEMKQSIPVKDAMTRKALTAGPATTVAKAAKIMSKNKRGSLIIAKSRKPIGIITERDILTKVVSEDLKPSEVSVDKIMSSPVVTTTADQDVIDATRTLVHKKIRHLPVTQGGRIIGVLTASDITAISPGLVELAPERGELPAEEEFEESVCEVCGEMTRTLHDMNGMLVCEDCRDFLSR